MIEGVGAASIKMESGENICLNNTLYVPSFKNNLVSILCI